MLALDPDLRDAISGLLFVLNYSPARTAEEIYAEYKTYDGTMAGHRRKWPPWQGGASNFDKKLKIGYVSGDFRQHAVGFFLPSVLEAHDKTGRAEPVYFPDKPRHGGRTKTFTDCIKDSLKRSNRKVTPARYATVIR